MKDEIHDYEKSCIDGRTLTSAGHQRPEITSQLYYTNMLFLLSLPTENLGVDIISLQEPVQWWRCKKKKERTEERNKERKKERKMKGRREGRKEGRKKGRKKGRKLV